MTEQDGQIVGAKRPAQGKASFAVAPAVARDASGVLFVVSQRATHEAADRLTEPEWRELLASGEAFELPGPEAYLPRAQVWLFRGIESWRPQLEALERTSEVVRSRVVRLPEENIAFAVVAHDGRADRFRASWAETLFNRAMQNAALPLAVAAHLVSPVWRPEYVALRCALLRRQGDEAGALAQMGVARRTCGDAFADLAAGQVGELEARLSRAAIRPALLQRRAAVRGPQTISLGVAA